MSAKSYLVGTGQTKFGNALEEPQLKDKTFQEMVADAAFEAMDDAGVGPEDIDAFYVGNMLSHTSQVYSHATLLADWLGLRNVGGYHFDTACSTTNTGLGIADQAIKSGKSKNVLVVAGEYTLSAPDPDNVNPLERKAIDASQLWKWTDFGVDHVYAYHHYYDIASAYGAFPTLAYMRKNNLSFEQMDEVMMEVNRAVRKHASMNPKAFVNKSLEETAEEAGFSNVKDFWKSQKNPFFAWPTRLFSALNAADGASAFVVSNDPSKKPCAEIAGYHWAASNYPWYDEKVNPMPQDTIAFEEAYKMAGITPEELDYLYVHDCMQIYQLVLSEVAGYLPGGQAWKAFLEGRTMYNGDKPLNISGGRHGVGHAFEASAGAEIYHLLKQIRGEAGELQMNRPPQVAAQHNHGYGMHSAVTIFKRVE
jgi:acetyl-CoA C-acetyltransferase